MLCECSYYGRKGVETMQAMEKLKRHLRPGQVYRRADLAVFSAAVDRHLRQLVDAGELKKLGFGVYHRPQKSVFGEVPAEEQNVVKAFLKDDDFLVMSLNAYNALGVGTTQLYNERLVYNRKRDGHMELNGQKYFFLKNRKFPKKVTEAFLLVDLVNNLRLLAEDRDRVKEFVAERALDLGLEELRRTATDYGNVATRKFFERLTHKKALSDGG